MKGSDTHEESPASKALSVTTDPTPNYGISLNPSGNYTFADAVWGYGAQTAYSVTVSNAGSQPTGNLTLASGGANGDSFTLSKTGIASLAVDGSDNFTVVPTTGLDAGAYVATVSITGGNGISATFSLNFTVNKAAQAAPAAPTLAGKTGASVTLNLIEGAEYRRDTEGWQDSPTFYGLTPNTGYAFYARMKATGNHEASPVSEALHETTLAIATAELLSLTVNGVPVSVESDELQYSAECEETSVTLDITASTPDITVNGAEYNNGQTIVLTEDVTVIDISLVSGDDQKTYTLKVMKSIEANSVLFRRWDGVLALIRNPKNNGNRKIDSVRWYVTGNEDVQGTGWFIRTMMDINDYNAKIRVSGNWHNVCGAPRAIPAGKVIAYPNPVSVGDNLTLQLPDSFVGGYVNVFDLTGAPVKQRLPLPGKVGVISVAGWSPGIYLLNVTGTNGDSETIKIIVNN
jgi:hypothetical protein